jgi:hypothetical protein
VDSRLFRLGSHSRTPCTLTHISFYYDHDSAFLLLDICDCAMTSLDLEGSSAGTSHDRVRFLPPTTSMSF